MGWLENWLDNLLMGGGEGKVMDLSLIEEKIPIDKHLEEGKKRSEEARKENEEEEKAEEGLKHVIDGAKLKCDLCVTSEGDLKVNFDTPTIQDKKIATIKEKDMTSLIFKGNCKKSPNSSSPCASVMQLGDWKDTGTSLIQDQPPLLLKSTIKCNYGGVDIAITDCGQKCEPEEIDVAGVPVPGVKKVDFDLKIEIVKDTFVPLGINDFQNKAENDKIKFRLIITGKGVNSWTFEIRTSNTLVYQCFSNTTELEEVVIVGKGSGSQNKQETPIKSAPMDRFWPAGSYIIEWDGFNNNEMYDSALMTNEEGFVASIIGQVFQPHK